MIRAGVMRQNGVFMSEPFVMDHPLIQHKLSFLRDKNTGSKEFRELVSEIAMLMCYEATRNLTLEEVEIETPIAIAKAKVISGKKLAFVPILRAGTGMLDGVLALVPSAKVGHIGMYRDPVTVKPVPYYCKLPSDISEREVIVLDPMLATGGSAVAAVDYIKEHGGQKIKFMSIIAAPKGVETLMKAHPDIQLYVGALDRELDDNAYIRPGLGDAGDRIFGTK